MNRLFCSLLALLPLVAGASHAGALANELSLEGPIDVDEDIELNREADDRLMDGQKPVPVSLSELASSRSFEVRSVIFLRKAV